MQFKSFLIVVKDIDKSKRFYKDLFGLDVVIDYDGNVVLSCGIALQQKDIWNKFTGKDIIQPNNSCELYFEEENLEKFITKLEQLYPNTQYVNRLMTHS